MPAVLLPPPRLARLLSSINHRPTMLEVTAERACVAALLGAPEASSAGWIMPALAVGCNARYDPAKVRCGELAAGGWSC